MKTRLLVMALAVAMSAPSAARAAGWAAAGRAASRELENFRFDPAAVTTLDGRVTEVRNVKGPRGPGVHLALATPGGNIDVHLGPKSYVDGQKVKIARGDEVKVTGVHATLAGAPTFIAQKVEKGGATLQLRDASGAPLWSRRAR